MDIHVDPVTIERLQGKLVVTPDNTTAGSEGRLYLQLPSEFDPYVGQSFRTLGKLAVDRGMMLLGGEEIIRTHTITPRRQIWWKNGVREHGIRENWWVWVYPLDFNILVVLLKERTGEAVPLLPPRQETIFPR